jgi:hypothetical protein
MASPVSHRVPFWDIVERWCVVIGLCVLIWQSTELRRTNNLAESATRIENRAWVGAISATPPQIEIGKAPQMGVVITNTGSTPALDVAARLTMAPGYNGTPPDFVHVGSSNGATSVVLQPGMTMTFPVSSGIFVTPEQHAMLTGVATKTAVYYMFGTIRYRDVFGADHSTDFCFFLQRDLKTVSGCPFYNSAN